MHYPSPHGGLWCHASEALKPIVRYGQPFMSYVIYPKRAGPILNWSTTGVPVRVGLSAAGGASTC